MRVCVCMRIRRCVECMYVKDAVKIFGRKKMLYAHARVYVLREKIFYACLRISIFFFYMRCIYREREKKIYIYVCVCIIEARGARTPSLRVRKPTRDQLRHSFRRVIKKLCAMGLVCCVGKYAVKIFGRKMKLLYALRA